MDPGHQVVTRADPSDPLHFIPCPNAAFHTNYKKQKQNRSSFFHLFFFFLKSFTLCLSFYKHKSYHCLYVFWIRSIKNSRTWRTAWITTQKQPYPPSSATWFSSSNHFKTPPDYQRLELTITLKHRQITKDSN